LRKKLSALSSQLLGSSLIVRRARVRELEFDVGTEALPTGCFPFVIATVKVDGQADGSEAVTGTAGFVRHSRQRDSASHGLTYSLRSSTSRQSDCSSRTSTLNDSGSPGSSGTSPLTIAS